MQQKRTSNEGAFFLNTEHERTLSNHIKGCARFITYIPTAFRQQGVQLQVRGSSTKFLPGKITYPQMWLGSFKSQTTSAVQSMPEDKMPPRTGTNGKTLQRSSQTKMQAVLSVCLLVGRRSSEHVTFKELELVVGRWRVLAGPLAGRTVLVVVVLVSRILDASVLDALACGRYDGRRERRVAPYAGADERDVQLDGLAVQPRPLVCRLVDDHSAAVVAAARFRRRRHGRCTGCDGAAPKDFRALVLRARRAAPNLGFPGPLAEVGTRGPVGLEASPRGDASPSRGVRFDRRLLGLASLLLGSPVLIEARPVLRSVAAVGLWLALLQVHVLSHGAILLEVRRVL